MMFFAQYTRALLGVAILVSVLSTSVAQTLNEPVYYPETLSAPTVNSALLTPSATGGATPEFMADFYDLPEYYPTTSAPGFGDSIDPLTQTLRIVHTDAVLKTNGGLDVPITRFYRHIHDNFFRSDERSKFNNFNSPLGLGWQMHFGRVMYSKDVPNPCLEKYHFMFETSTGDLQQFFWHAENKRFVSKQFWTATCFSPSAGQFDITIKTPSGMTYEARFSNDYHEVKQIYVTKVRDANKNVISIEYAAKDGVAYMTKISTGNERTGVTNSETITLSYNLTGKPRLENINVPGLNSIYYNVTEENTHTPHIARKWLGNKYAVLKRVTLPSYESWTFTYNPGTATDGQYSLASQTHPDGGKVEYNYKERNKFTSAIKQSWSGAGITAGERTYDSGKIDGNFFRINVKEPDGTIIEYFYYNKSDRNPRWQVGLLHQVETNRPGQSFTGRIAYEYRTYKLSDHGVYSSLDTSIADGIALAPVVYKKTIQRSYDKDENNNTPAGHDTFNYYYDYEFNATTKENRSSMQPYGIGVAGPNGSKSYGFSYVSKFDQYGVRKTKETVSGIVGEVTYAHDNYGNILEKNAYGVKTTFSYHADGEVHSITDANGHITTYHNYEYGIPKRVSLPESVSIKRMVQAPGRITSQTNGRGYTTKYGYDDAGRINKITPPSQSPTYFHYDTRKTAVAKGRLCVIDRFDGRGRLIERTARAFEETVIDEYADPPNNACDTQVYQGELITLKTKDTSVTFGYDPSGRANFVSLPNKSIGTRTTFDRLSRIKRRCLGTACTNYQYLSDNRVKVTDGEGRVQINQYRGIDNDSTLIKNVKKLSDSEEITVTLTKDALNRTKQVASHGLVSTYTYEKKKIVNGQEKMVYYPFLVSYTDTQTGTENYTYDNVGNVKTKTHNGKKVRYDYDGLNRLEEVNYPDAGGDVYYSYDKNSNVKSAKRSYEDVVTWVKNYRYNDADQLTQLQHVYDYVNDTSERNLSYTFEYDYDKDGSSSSMTYPSGRTLSYFPDAYGRPSQVGNYATNLKYHDNGAIKSYRLGNGKSVSYGLDAYDRVNSILVPNVMSRTYGYDKSHNIISRTDTISNRNSTIVYDRANRLFSETVTGGNSIRFNYGLDQSIASIVKNGQSRSLSIDPVKRRPTVNGNGDALSYDGFGSIQFVVPRDVTKPKQEHRYLTDGTLAFIDTETNKPTPRTSYRNPDSPINAIGPYLSSPVNAITAVPYIDPRDPYGMRPETTNRARAADNSNTMLFYAYDADNQRFVSNNYGYRTFHMNGTDGVLAEYKKVLGEAGKLKLAREYVRLGGKVIAQLDPAEVAKWLFKDSFEDNFVPPTGGTSGGSLVPTYLHTDVLGTPVAATNATGQLQWRSYRMAYGMPEQGNDLGELDTEKHPIGYTGHYEDKESGLTYANARYYHSNSATFMSPDKLTFRQRDLSSINRYVYASNNPYRYVDPTGMAAIGCTFDNSCPEGDPMVLAGAADELSAGATTWVFNKFGADIDTENSEFKNAATAVMIVTGPKGWLQGGLKKGAKFLGTLFKKTCCFVAGTKVLTESGYKNIEDIKLGERLWSKDVLSGEEDWKPVTKVWIEPNRGIYEIRVVNKDGFVQKIQATDDHPFWVIGKGWTKTIELVVSDKIETKETGSVKVISIVDTKRTDVTYNFTVADFHSYYVTEQNLLVHNCNFKELLKNIDRLSPSDKKSVNSLIKQIDEHKKKLEEYKKNPYQFDNKGFLKDAPNNEVRERIIKGRINHLEREISAFQKAIIDIFNGIF